MNIQENEQKGKLKQLSKWFRQAKGSETGQRIWEIAVRTVRYAFLLGISILALYLLANFLLALLSMKLLDPQTVFSLWVAEVPLAVLFRYIFGDRIPDRADLVIRRVDVKKNGKTTYFSAIAANKGRSTAEQCRAWISLNDWHDSDLLANPGGQVKKVGYHRTISCNLKWPNKSEEIRPDDEDLVISLFRMIEEGTERIELPSEANWDGLSASLALTSRTYTGSITIGARNAKPAIKQVRISKLGYAFL